MRPIMYAAIALAGLVTTPTAAWAQAWVRCADEGQRCAFAGLKMVRYGAAGQFRLGTFTDGVSCTNAVFGNPIAGTPKACWMYNTVAEVAEEQAHAKLDEWAQNLNRRVGEMQADMQARGELIDELNAIVAARDQHIRQLDEQVRQRDERISQLEAQLQSRERRPSGRGTIREELRERMRERGLGPWVD